MNTKAITDLLTTEYLEQFFPPGKMDDFFEALFGDAEEGAYDVSLSFRGCTADTLSLALLLRQRPGRCLACNLTQGLPAVFTRHPVIDIKGIVETIDKDLGETASLGEWTLGQTQERDSSLHMIPLTIRIL